MRTLPLLLSALLFACIEAPTEAQSPAVDATVADAAARPARRARPAEAPDAARRAPTPPPDAEAPPPEPDAAPLDPDAAPPSRADAAPPPAPDAEPPPPDAPPADCADLCADEVCGARCAALAGALTAAAFSTWATCMADDPTAGPPACLAALDCGAADALIGQHCDAIGRCDSVGRGWFDEAACRDAPYAQTAAWRCLRPDRRAELSACLAGSTCDALDTCLRYAACADDTVCPELIATELIAE